jgi:hypothetical protein
MTVKQLAERCGFELLVGGAALEKPVSGGYCGDLLSWVMGRAQNGCAWITVMGNENTIAVAVLAEVACIILAEGAALDEKAASRADENGVAVLKSEKPAFAIALLVAKELKLTGEANIARELVEEPH